MYIHYHSLWNGCSIVFMLLLVNAPTYFGFLAVAVSLGTDYAKYKHRLPNDDEFPRSFWYVSILQACSVLILFLLLRLVI